ncbi:YkuS family protein [Chryseobacterium herbae]|uniref:YkuS family protein n=1 Tax=Chryseobacterium herbae TaxID=2976476 RepID=A0ABT2IZ58_9FLAO|nr:YkuS family protein [Chryseobacterium sp. pc1-10]MCT2563967.1 YkuS family protein [Chryseobacterium sp. pc1-10]
MVKINCHWYTSEEIKEALEKKGYSVVTLEISTEKRDFPLYETYALKNGEEATVLNTAKSIALKEFNKKPPLI